MIDKQLRQWLLIEDDETHARMFKRCLDKVTNVSLLHVDNGDTAFDYLNKNESNFAPELIVLDLNLPGKSGFEILSLIRNSESLKSVIVVVLSTSNSKQDIRDAYNGGANAYLSKPIDFDEYILLINSLVCFWAHWNQSNMSLNLNQ